MILTANVKHVTGRTKHYFGATFQEDGSFTPGCAFSAAARVEITCDESGYLLFRYDSEGGFAGDTWSASLEDAKHQAKLEFEISEDDWRQLPQDETPAFPNLVKKYFAYLLDEYGFVVARSSDYIVHLESDKCRVTVILDKNTIDVNLCSLEYEVIRRTHIPLSNIVPPARFRELLLPLGEDTTPSIADQDKVLSVFASLLKEYGDDVLKGDFSRYHNANK